MSLTIVSQIEPVVTISSRDFLELPTPARPDFNVFVPCDINSLFAALHLRIPAPDADPNDPSPPDQNQLETGDFVNTDWRSVYVQQIMPTLATEVSRYVDDQKAIETAQLKILFEKIICELFLGYPSTDQRFTSASLSLKTDTYIAPWLNGAAAAGDIESWGQKCFDSTHFDTIATQLVAAGKYLRAEEGTPTEHGRINLSAGDSIGVRVKLSENPKNYLHVNFYLQQTAANIDPLGPIPDEVMALVTPHNLTSNTSDPSFLVTVSSTRGSNDGWKAFNGLFFWPEMWESVEGTHTLHTGVATSQDTFNPGTGPIPGPWLQVTLNEPKQFNRYRIARLEEMHTTSAPTSWRLYGKNDGDTVYSLIESVDGYTYQTDAAYEPVRVIGLSTYKYIVFHVVQVVSLSWCGIGELDFFRV